VIRLRQDRREGATYVGLQLEQERRSVGCDGDFEAS
jgi:hypothetical protein